MKHTIQGMPSPVLPSQICRRKWALTAIYLDGLTGMPPRNAELIAHTIIRRESPAYRRLEAALAEAEGAA
jgi:hypothetical protein